jgi:hypothetical protein
VDKKGNPGSMFIGPGFFILTGVSFSAPSQINMEERMYLYWRIQQDLNCLGEFILFHDPALKNAMHKWAKRNFKRMALAESIETDRVDTYGPDNGPVLYKTR